MRKRERTTHIVGGVSGSHNNIGTHHEMNNYSGMSREDLIAMVEERFQYASRKEEQIELIFDENRKLTDEVIRQNADFRIYNEAYRRQVERIAELTDRLLGKEISEKLE